MIGDIRITEKSYGPKNLVKNIKFSIDDGEKIGIIGRNGVGKSTLFNILSGFDDDYSGEIVFRRGVTTISTRQEHIGLGDITVLQYILQELPEYSKLTHIIETYPEVMGDDINMIEKYSEALERYSQKGFHEIESQIERELSKFQLENIKLRSFDSLSGGQKRLVEIIKIMRSDVDLALIDEPTNHMDYVAKQRFINWMKKFKESILVITHDRDVLQQVDRIIELKDGESLSFKGDYQAYLRQNVTSTGSAMERFEQIERRIDNLKIKVVDYQRLKEKSRNPSTIQKFKRLEYSSRKELAELQENDKPTFWIDRLSAEQLNHKTSQQYQKFKAKNLRIRLNDAQSRNRRVALSASGISLGFEKPLFTGVDIDLREGEALELRGRNGIGKTTLIKHILDQSDATKFAGELKVDSQIRIGIYEQEVSSSYFNMALEDAIEKMYLDKGLSINMAKIRALLHEYLFTDSDSRTLVKTLSGGQKSRFQLISMLANDPQLLILDEPTNHLDLPSIEELETALERYSGALLYVSHDNHFRNKIGGEVLNLIPINSESDRSQN